MVVTFKDLSLPLKIAAVSIWLLIIYCGLIFIAGFIGGYFGL